ncbi:MAG: adenosine kinase [Verrucomicrobiota bacterium]
MEQQAKLIAVGSALVDQLAYVPEDFVASIKGEKGGMELVELEEMNELLNKLPESPLRAPGGSAANTIVGAARLGLNTGMLSKVGNDEAGDFYRRSLRDAGVDDSAFKVNEEVATGTCISLITPDSERTMRTYLGAAATLAPEDVTPADFAGCTHAHLEGYLLFNHDLIMQVLKGAKEQGCKISLDLAAPEVVTANMDDLSSIVDEYVDIALANESEAAAFTGEKEEQKALAALAERCETAVVKVGSRGAWIQQGDEIAGVPIYGGKGVDTTGAGDLWASGFLYGLLSGWSLERAGMLGAHVSGEVVHVTGAMLPEEAWQRVFSRFEELKK